MAVNTSLVLPLACVCLLSLAACGSDSAESVPALPDAAADVEEPDGDPPDGLDAGDEPFSPEDGASDAAVEAGPASCEEPCSSSCAAHKPIEGECGACVDSVCGAYSEKATTAPNRTALFECMDGCGSDTSCPNTCCSKYQVACAWEVAFEMCTCGFPEESCSADCKDSCSKAGMTEACGVCGSQSPCSFATFTYLFAPSRFSHQDCVETCTSSSLTLQECLDRCRKDYPEAGSAYDGFLACVCK